MDEQTELHCHRTNQVIEAALVGRDRRRGHESWNCVVSVDQIAVTLEGVLVAAENMKSLEREVESGRVKFHRN